MKKIDVTGEDVIIVFSREINVKGWLIDTSDWRALIIKPVARAICLIYKNRPDMCRADDFDVECKLTWKK